MALLILVTIIILLLLTKADTHIPPARHCSLVISAACHPLPDDVDNHLRPVSWGVVKESTEDESGHCTITSHYVHGPVAYLYA